MLRVIVLFVVLAAVLGDDKAFVSQHKHCYDKLNAKSMRCCKSDVVKASTEKAMQLIKECFKIPEGSCENEVCMGTKIGYSTAEGKVDKVNAPVVIENHLGTEKDLAAAVINKCVNGDLSLYGEADACEMVKYGRCARIQMLGRCNNWDTEGQCEEIKKTTIECFKDFP